jgi:hypothetical protein
MLPLGPGSIPTPRTRRIDTPFSVPDNVPTPALRLRLTTYIEYAVDRTVVFKAHRATI